MEDRNKRRYANFPSTAQSARYDQKLAGELSHISFCSAEPRVKVLAQSDDSAGTHILVAPAGQKLCDPVGDFFREPCLGARLEKRELIQAVVIIVQDNVARHLRVVAKP
jgi:hypothetical protein